MRDCADIKCECVRIYLCGIVAMQQCCPKVEFMLSPRQSLIRRPHLKTHCFDWCNSSFFGERTLSFGETKEQMLFAKRVIKGSNGTTVRQLRNDKLPPTIKAIWTTAAAILMRRSLQRGASGTTGRPARPSGLRRLRARATSAGCCAWAGVDSIG